MSIRIAMWSGPRNISTAMMRAWENRGDTAVWDEPLYAYYLARTGLDHPMRDQVIAAGETDWRKVITACCGEIPEGKPVFYQKHMAHHLLPEISYEWLDQLSHCFLIRDPREVLLSYSKKRATVTLEDVGLPQQVALFEHVQTRTGTTPIVIDSADFLQQPEKFLQILCTQLGIDFTERMLSWPAGARSSDGVWARHWYGAVWQSTGFTPYRSRGEALPVELQPLAEQAWPYYRTLYRQRLQVEQVER